MPVLISRIGALAALMALAACGGKDVTSGSSGAPGNPARGTLLQSPQQVSTISAASLSALLGQPGNATLFALSGSPVCDISMYSLEYATVGGANEYTTASAALMVPSGSGSQCSGGRPILLYAHGTTPNKNFNMTDTQNAETVFLAALFASQGYIVVAPNYAGYDISTLSYHPFLVADQQSKDMIDALTAARTALPLESSTQAQDSGQLFVTGYSQGGFVAMATHRAMQAAGIAVTAAAPMSGPYALAAFVDAVFYGQVNLDGVVAATLLENAYQHSYGNVYAAPTDVFEAPYAANIGTLLPSATPISQLYAANSLPSSALFSSTPPAPTYADITPPTSPANLAPEFALGFGTDNLILNSYRLAYLQDAQANPDGGFPNVGSGLPAATPGITIRQDLKLNDLRNWSPRVPVQLCGGDNDPDVFWMNTLLMQAYWTASPPTVAPAYVDMEVTASGDSYAPYKQGFAAAKTAVAVQAIAQGATDGGALAVAQAYHATLVAPFCFAVTKVFFGKQ